MHFFYNTSFAAFYYVEVSKTKKLEKKKVVACSVLYANDIQQWLKIKFIIELITKCSF